MPRDPARRYETIEWLMFQMAGIGPIFGQVGFFNKFAGKAWEDKRPLERYVAESKRLLEVLQRQLAGRAWIMGDEYTIADIAAFPWLRNIELLAIDLGKRPHLKAWVEKIAARDAVKRAYAKIATIKSVRDSASDDAKDRFFGRGKYAQA